MERETGIEPATNSLEGCDSTIELLPLNWFFTIVRTSTSTRQTVDPGIVVSLMSAMVNGHSAGNISSLKPVSTRTSRTDSQYALRRNVESFNNDRRLGFSSTMSEIFKRCFPSPQSPRLPLPNQHLGDGPLGGRQLSPLPI
jgi:hypothetical protein